MLNKGAPKEFLVIGVLRLLRYMQTGSGKKKWRGGYRRMAITAAGHSSHPTKFI